jgi:hypothetical protein
MSKKADRTAESGDPFPIMLFSEFGCDFRKDGLMLLYR